MERDPLETPIQYVKGVGPQRAGLLARLRITTIRDALTYLPYRYEDRRQIRKIRELTPGNLQTVVGRIISSGVLNLQRSRYKIFELVISDGTGLLRAKWFNQPYLKKRFPVGQEVLLSGTVKPNNYGGGLEMDRPEHEFVTEDETDQPVHTARIVPIYRTTAGLSVRVLRQIMHTVLDSHLQCITDPLPPEIIKRHSLTGLAESIGNVHFPPPDTDTGDLNRGVSPYHRRLSFDELLCLEVGMAILKSREAKTPGIAFSCSGRLVADLRERLPFRLTAAQERVFDEVLHDMQQPFPMHRLVQGDVGCGKTVVALMALLTAVECGYQGALMAPTEILAEQHYLNILRLTGDLGPRIALLTSGRKESVPEENAFIEADIVVGTHALIQEGVRFRRLGLAVIDEQHRFGVLQRAALRKKAEHPDVLVMTATPIPRTLAMTLYGDLDYSVIDELPPMRTPVFTRVFPHSEKRAVYDTIASEVAKGRQVYVVYPVIEESEVADLKSAITGRTALERIFPAFRIGLVHGKMKTAEREAVMASFKDGAIDVLVSTTVIEVGVDVPNATLMLIVHAERFGLSQLHQLRGRVGRGGGQSQCFLLAYEPLGEESRRRLRVMTETTDGFRIAEEDLAIRGPGDFLGTRQSGLPDLRVADIIRDARLLEAARREAFSIIGSYPEIDGLPALKKAVGKAWQGKIEIFRTG